MTLTWRRRLGSQRDWLWRGWQIRYCFRHPPNPSSLPPLILLHGFGVSLEHWRGNIGALSESTSVYALDLLGFGGSRKADTPYSAYLWAEQVYEFWRQTIGAPVVVVGNSIGALVAMTLTYQYPEMVAGLVMLSLPDVSLRQSALPPWLQSLANGAESLLAPPWLLKTLFRFVREPRVIRPWVGLAYCDQTSVDEELVAIISSPPQDVGAEQAFYRLFNSVRQPGFSPPARLVLPQLSQPVLLIWGEQDRLVPSALAKGFAGLNAQIQLELWPGVGHCPQDECPARFNQTLLEWLRERF
ncbi:MAG: alpha/beta fold hydrolase [Cyanobacteriota bacterium]|jgi:pimeloyl-ACP methyl ester carboxylesterase